MARVTDPVCWMEFDERHAAAQTTWRGRSFYFCHLLCKRIFDASPARFVGKKARERANILKLNFARDDSKTAA